MNEPPPASDPLAVFPSGIDLPAAEVFQMLLEAAPDAVLVIGPDGRIRFANGESERMFGYGRAELIGQPVELLVPERLRGRHHGHRARYVSAPTRRPMGLDMDLTARRRDGTEFPVEIALSPVKLDGLTLISAAIRDMSRLHKARAAVARGRFQAHVAELGQRMIGARELTEIAEAVPEVIRQALGADVVLCYLVNPAANACTLCASRGLPDTVSPAQVVDNQARTAPGFVLAACDTVVVSDYAEETRFDPDPVVTALGLTSALCEPIRGDSDPVGVLMAQFRARRTFSEDDQNFLRSVANIAGAALKCLHAEDRMRHAQRLEAVGQLTGGIAHDFNNLLTVIMGNLQLVREDVADDESVAPAIEAALRAAGSAAELTRKLLAFSRRQALRPRAIEVNELVGGMLDMIRRTLGERISILAFPDPHVPPVLADPAQLETALLNLVVNARDAMPRGGRLSIETGIRTLGSDYTDFVGDVRPGRYVMVAVSDNGVGMPREVLKRAFDPYFTTKERGKGSGLGLSMVHGFAKQSMGHVAIYSEPGVGTTVRLYLPLASEQAPAMDTASPRALPGGDELVLMVEDDAQVRELGARFLLSLGYRVLKTADTDSALALLESHPDIRLLFTDIVLPGRLNGIELAREARRRRPELTLLFTSGYASGAVDDMQKLPGPLLDKPYRRETLAGAIRAALDRRAP